MHVSYIYALRVYNTIIEYNPQSLLISKSNIRILKISYKWFGNKKHGVKLWKISGDHYGTQIIFICK